MISKWTQVEVTTVTQLIFLLVQVCSSAKVLDIGDQFPELIKNHPTKSWLVKFYAPWCHHCQQLEPTYNNVAETIYHKHDHLIVGRIDCTKYGKICEEFQIDSYPTIMFVNSDNRVKYKGYRSEDAMVAFAERLNGPDVGNIDNCYQLKDKLTDHESIVLSMIRNSSSEPSKVFEFVAKTHKTDYWFYQINPKRPVLKDCDGIPFEGEGIYLIKKYLTKFIKYTEEPLEEDSTSEDVDKRERLLNWLAQESLPVYGRIDLRNIEQNLATGKILVLSVLDEYKPAQRVSRSSEKFKLIFQPIAQEFSARDEFFNTLLFGWISDMDLLEYITLNSIKTKPNVIVVNQDLSYHLMIDDDSELSKKDQYDIPVGLTRTKIELLLKQILDGKLEFSGGNTYLHMFLRSTLGNINKFIKMYRANPLLVSLIFGFPCAILIFVIYTTCFYDGSDEGEYRQINSDCEDLDSDLDQEELKQQERLLNNDHLKQD